MEHLLSAWQKIAEPLKNARHILLLADYDGTLTPIAERPDLANLPQSTRQLLQTLAHQPHFTLGVISGRALADLKAKVKIDGIIYAGNHGLEMEGPGVNFTHPLAGEISQVLPAIHQRLRVVLRAIKGIVIEDKGLTLSVHYRQVEESKAKEVESIFRGVVGDAVASGKVRITLGKKVYEVRPAIDWDKGKAIKLLIEKYQEAREGELLPVYLGDDLTDEDAFRAIAEYRNGIAIFVGEVDQDSAAPYFLKSPVEVTEFLGILLEQA